MTYNRITAEIGESRRITTRPVSYQYDTVQILMLTAAEGVELPEYYQVDFCVIGDEDTVTMVGSLSGGATIPDGLLRQGENLVAYLVLTGAEGDVQTRYEITIPVNERPTRSGIELSDDQQAQVDSLIEALNDGVDRAEAAVEAVQDMGVEAETLAAGSAASVEKEVDPETGAVTLTFGIPRGSQGNPGTTPDFQIGTVETLPATSPATATITGTPAEPVLNLGIPQGPKGDPGSGGTTDYRELENKPQINGHTLNGNQSASDLGLGTYSKPDTGIPKTDLASDVQQSLGKADSALQSAPVSSVAGKTGDVTLAADDVSFDDSATYAAGSVGAELSAQSNAISANEETIGELTNEILITEQSIKNLFDPKWLENIGLSKNENVYYGLGSVFNNKAISFEGETNTRYTLSCLVKTDGLASQSGTGLRVRWKYADETTSAWYSLANNETSWTQLSYTCGVNVTVAGIEFNISSALGNTWYLKDVQVEKGNQRTAYEPFSTESIRSELVNGKLTDSPEFFPGYISSTGAINTAQAGYDQGYSYKIAVAPGSIIDVSITYPSAMSFWYCRGEYDASGTFIRRITSAILQDVTTYTDKFAVSNDAHYVAFSVYHMDVVDFDYTVRKNAFESFSDIDDVAETSNLKQFKYQFIKGVNHRGYSSVAPENTIPAYIMSRKKGFTSVETDVQFTSDDVPVLIHDTTINRTARNADGTAISSTINIADISYQDVLDYDFGIWKGAEYAGTKIPTLAEFVAFCKKAGIEPYIELKAGTAAQIELAINTLKSYDMLRHSVIESFYSTGLLDLLPNEKYKKIAVVCDAPTSSIISYAQGFTAKANEVVILAHDYSSTTVQMCLEAGLPLEIWTIDSIQVLDNLDVYVSTVITDRLPIEEVKLREALNEPVLAI